MYASDCLDVCVLALLGDVCVLALLGDDIINCNNLTPQNHGDCIRTLTAASYLCSGVLVSPCLDRVRTCVVGQPMEGPAVPSCAEADGLQCIV
jgi:hypothetical protein